MLLLLNQYLASVFTGLVPRPFFDLQSVPCSKFRTSMGAESADLAVPLAVTIKVNGTYKSAVARSQLVTCLLLRILEVSSLVKSCALRNLSIHYSSIDLRPP